MIIGVSGVLPATYKGLLFKSASEPATLTEIPTPKLDAGSVFVKPLFSWVQSYANELYTNGNPRRYAIPFPTVGGTGAIGRVVAVGPDTTKLDVGDLVTVEPIIRMRDDPDIYYVQPLGPAMTERARGVTRSVWRHGSWAELVKAPLENVLRIDEDSLRRHGVAIHDLGFLGQLVIPYGGLRDVNLSAGETVLISPATGGFGGAAVHVALAMGARVIAMGRNETILAELKALAPSRIETVTISGSEEADVAALSRLGIIDVFYDLTPRKVTNLSHIRAGILSVRSGGRISFSGGVEDINIPYKAIMDKNLTVKGTTMYTREQALELIKMVETGVLRLGPKAGLIVKHIFKLEDWAEAIETAAKEAGAGSIVLFAPTEG
ncbi:hypothetical protein DL769_011075 [Monosporascus sp. CRB-8-3]|nr:hypothetical protein DL769_011075 [Monosporascus sp. CRB-8-3]